ncbi:MAG: hypothetical protein JXR63_09400 [Spirochaetales bacterium]|nr:hypothetical protein [Spirochaetales bacterium]
MSKVKTIEYIKKVEGLVDPETIAITSIASSFFKNFPVKLQKKLLKNASKKNPYMGFIVEPYAFFLCFEIVDMKKAEELVPEGFRIVPFSMFDGDEKKNCVIFGCFSARTSAFSGNRVEMYIIAENTQSGMLSWIIADYDTNTNSYDPDTGFTGSTTQSSTITTTCNANIVVDMKSLDGKKHISTVAKIKTGKERGLDQRLWLEGNLSVAYGDKLDDGDNIPFGLIFDPDEMKSAIEVDCSQVRIEELNWHDGLFSKTPLSALYFPYAQHFITTAIPKESQIKDINDLENAVNEFNKMPEIRGMSAKAIKRSFLIGSAISMSISAGMIIWIILLYALGN